MWFFSTAFSVGLLRDLLYHLAVSERLNVEAILKQIEKELESQTKQGNIHSIVLQGANPFQLHKTR